NVRGSRPTPGVSYLQRPVSLRQVGPGLQVGRDLANWRNPGQLRSLNLFRFSVSCWPRDCFSTRPGTVMVSPVEICEHEEEIRQERVRLEERTRIARELHDTLLQTVQSACFHLAAALDDVASGSSVKPRLERTLELMSQSIEEARNAIEGLRSS